MEIPITIPRRGWTMEEGIFVAWLRKDGDRMRAGEPLFTLESEKATEEIECIDEGILRIPTTGPQPGDTVKVGAVIGYLTPVGQVSNLTSETLPGPSTSAAPRPALEGWSGWKPDLRQAISPRARRLAKQLGVDATTLKGSGRTGRVR